MRHPSSMPSLRSLLTRRNTCLSVALAAVAAGQVSWAAKHTPPGASDKKAPAAATPVEAPATSSAVLMQAMQNELTRAMSLLGSGTTAPPPPANAAPATPQPKPYFV